MSNITANSIVINVPKHLADDLIAALKGPGYHWAMDGAYFQDESLEKLSNHEILACSKGTALHNSAREAYLAAGMPEWMEIGIGDVQYYKSKNGDISRHICVEEIPISLVKFRPWQGLEEYQAQRGNLLNFQYATFGCKWELNFDTGRLSDPRSLDVHESSGMKQLIGYCDTASGPPIHAGEILKNVLADHCAKMAWLFVNENNEGAGYLEVDASGVKSFHERDPALIADPNDEEYQTLDEDALLRTFVEQGADENLIAEVLGR